MLLLHFMSSSYIKFRYCIIPYFVILSQTTDVLPKTDMFPQAAGLSMVFIENDVSMESQSPKSECVFFCNQTEILGVGIGSGVLVIAAILAVTCCFYMKKKSVPSEKETVDEDVIVGVTRDAVV